MGLNSISKDRLVKTWKRTQLSASAGAAARAEKIETNRPTPTKTPSESSQRQSDSVAISREATRKEESRGNLPNLAAAFGSFDEPQAETSTPAKEKPPQIMVAEKTERPCSEPSKAETSAKAKGLIEKNTNLGGLNLDEESLGKDLANSKDPAATRETLRQLSRSDRSEVSYETLKAMSDEQMSEMAKTPEGRATLSRVGSNVVKKETRGYENSPEEKTQLERLEKLTGQKPQPYDATKSMAYKGEIPKALDAASDDEGKVDLSKVTPEMINGLSSDERKNLMQQVDKANVYSNVQESNEANGKIEPASQYLLNKLAGQEDSNQAVTDAFTSLPRTTQSTMTMSPEVARKVVDQMPRVISDLKQDLKPGEHMKRAQGDVIANIVRNYPANDGEQLKALVEKINESKDSMPAERMRGYNEGWLTGAVLKGFSKKGDEFKDRARTQDMAGEFLDLVPGGTAIGVGLKAGLKHQVQSNERRADQLEGDAVSTATDIREAWVDDPNIDPDTVKNMALGLDNGREDK